MNNHCVISEKSLCFKKEKNCASCDVKKIESMDQLIPQVRTTGDLRKILEQYPDDTIITGITDAGLISGLLTIQANCPDFELNNVGLYFY